ncbi:beta-glucosidase [Colletotrichum cuscutae]|uniref:beta-glucosidase n=1 Tax=Colletotrichum cuscutae TaxID=1209917 RepID=A0AAI9VD02_9PEZI|nr:beta-glucosidase [Colletotrichum cuscutae]
MEITPPPLRSPAQPNEPNPPPVLQQWYIPPTTYSLSSPAALHIHVPKANHQQKGTRDKSTALALANTLISHLTLEEKVSMITGNSSAGNCIGVIAPIPRLGFKGICMLDGPSAVNRADLVSIFPAGITAAATWDREMIHHRGVAIAEEFKGEGGGT